MLAAYFLTRSNLIVPDSPFSLFPPYTVSPTMNPISSSQKVYSRLQSTESSNVTYFLLLEKNSKTSEFPFESVNSTTPSQEPKPSLLKSKNSTCQKDGQSENDIPTSSSFHRHPASELLKIVKQRIVAIFLILFTNLP